MVKVGGVNEKLISRKYKLTLIDKKGQELQIDVHGIDKITSDIQAINLDGIHRLFRNVTGRNNKANRRSRCINWFRIRWVPPTNGAKLRTPTTIEKSIRKMHWRNSSTDQRNK